MKPAEDRGDNLWKNKTFRLTEVIIMSLGVFLLTTDSQVDVFSNCKDAHPATE